MSCIAYKCKDIVYKRNAYRKKVNAKVRNYDLRDLDNEMNKKDWNFIEINELSGWNLVPLRK